MKGNILEKMWEAYTTNEENPNRIKIWDAELQAIKDKAKGNKPPSANDKFNKSLNYRVSLNAEFQNDINGLTIGEVVDKKN